MVLTAAQTQAFFEEAGQMGIPHPTVVQLQTEGIVTVEDLEEIDKDTLKQIAKNLHKPAGRVPNPDDPAAGTIPTPPFVFGAKSMKRLKAASDLVRFYATIGQPVTAANMRWSPIIRNFELQWSSLVERKDEDVDVPKITKALPIMKWTEAFLDHLDRKVGKRHIPLSYVICELEDPPVALPPLAPNLPHSTEHGSVEGDLIA